MGKQTDAHVLTVTDSLAKLQTSMRRVDVCRTAVDQAWSNMMAAYDQHGGKAASTPLGAPLKASVTNYDAAVTATKNHAQVASTAMNAFNTFVLAKDKGTWNPLAKKSIGKAKKFVQTQKPIIDALVRDVNALSSLASIVTSAQGVYF